MSDREQVRQLIFENFKNGYSSNPVSGYCHYILYRNKKWVLEHLTSGISLSKGEIAIPPKYYSGPEEMYDDIKLYFNPKN